MDDQILQQLKTKLLTEKEGIEKSLDEFAHRDKKAQGGWDTNKPNFGDMHQDEGERADEVEEYENEISMEDSLEGRLGKINAALEKVEKGTYGTCDTCKNEISTERLQVNPEANICMSCGL